MCSHRVPFLGALLTIQQEIAPVYYDLETFEKGEVKSALTRVAEKIRRRQAIKGGR